MLEYCDYIAHTIHTALNIDKAVDFSHIGSVGGIHYDLDEQGAFVSSAKTIEVYDTNGQKYHVTVQRASK
jgi:hypothetical protein